MTRILVALAAVLVIGWLALMELDLRRQTDGVNAAQRRDFVAADADFRAARRLNPDTAPDINRAFVYERMGRHREAAAVLEDVVRREPDNLTAWGLLKTFTRERDPALARRAQAAVRRLDPLRAR